MSVYLIITFTFLGVFYLFKNNVVQYNKEMSISMFFYFFCRLSNWKTFSFIISGLVLILVFCCGFNGLYFILGCFLRFGYMLYISQ